VPAFTSNPIGATFSWNNDNTSTGLSNGGSGNIADFSSTLNNTNQDNVSQVLVTASLGACLSAIDTFNLSIYKSPELDTLPDLLFCGDDSVNIEFVSTLGSTVHWSNDNAAIGLAMKTDSTGNIRFVTMKHQGLVAIEAHLTAFAESVNGCPSVLRSFKISVLPTPKQDQLADVSVCEGDSVKVNFTGVTAGASVEWFSSNPLIGLAGFGTGNIAYKTPVVAATGAVGQVIAHVLWNGCYNAFDTFDIVIKPRPSGYTPVADFVVCPKDTIDVPTFTSTTGATIFNWTNSNPAIGLAANGTGQIPTFTVPDNVSDTALTAMIIVTPILEACAAVSDTFRVIVKPRSDINPTPDFAYCEYDSVHIYFTGMQMGAVAVWQNSNPFINIQTTNSGDIHRQVQVLTLAPKASGQFVVKADLNGCFSPNDTFLITVGARPDSIVPMADMIFCPHTLVQFDTFRMVPNYGESFLWINSNPAIGLDSSGMGHLPAFTTAENTSDTVMTAQIIVRAGLNGCLAYLDTFVISLKSRPLMDSVANVESCGAGDMVTVPWFTSPHSGVITYDWVNDNPAIGLPASGSGDIQFMVPANVSDQTAIITVTPTKNGCVGVARTFKIFVRRPVICLPVKIVRG
jgi:hypothetical protein